MPYNIINPGSVEDAWNNPQSVFNQAQDNDRQTQAVQQGLLNQTMQNYGNAVQNAVEEPIQPAVPTAATQMAAQGNNMAARRPTAAEYEAGVINYLVNNRGYSYEDAQQLMAPRIQAYKMQEAAENRNMADNLIANMQNMDIASPKYRQAAFQLYRLDPQMGTFMLKEGIGPREQYLRGQKLDDQQTAMQQRKELATFNSNLQFDNWMRKLGVQDARQQQQIATNFQRYKAAGLDDQTAMLYALGVNGKRGGAAVPGATGVSDKDYKRAVDALKALDDEVAEGRLTDPTFQLSPQKQQQYNMLYAVKQRGDNEFFARNGVGQQKQKQPVKINPNDYNSVGPFIQWAVEQNKGFTPELARAIRAKLGFNPDDNSQNNFVNQIFKSHYNFSG
jgi:hypothetical protein